MGFGIKNVRVQGLGLVVSGFSALRSENTSRYPYFVQIWDGASLRLYKKGMCVLSILKALHDLISLL